MKMRLKKLYQKLPHDIKRYIYILLKRKSYQRYAQLRKSKNIYGHSLKEFDEYKCIYVHIPKCAGLSICKVIFGNKGPGHINIKAYQKIFSKKEFDTYFKFSIVRNPYDRLLSAYEFLKNGGISKRDINWARENILKYKNFDEFVKKWVTRNNIYSYDHFIPQHEFICIDGSIMVDFLGGLERIEEDFNTITDKLNINVALTHTNNGNRCGGFLDYYCRDAMEIVYNVYKSDFDILGYDSRLNS
jgi:hypothetical protein